jgi:hypothetical protein
VFVHFDAYCGSRNTVTIEPKKPAVDREVLYLLSGMLWSLVGIMLCMIAIPWISPLPAWQAVLIGIGGMCAAALIAVFGFSRVARKNIARISSYGERVCLFAFQSSKSYLNIVVMIGMGWLLRHSSLPKIALAPLYFGLGGALFASSALYFIQYRAVRRIGMKA